MRKGVKIFILYYLLLLFRINIFLYSSGVYFLTDCSSFLALYSAGVSFLTTFCACSSVLALYSAGVSFLTDCSSFLAAYSVLALYS